MSGIKFKGDTSGEILLETPAVAGTNTLTLPAETGTLATTTEINNVYNSLGTRNLLINGNMQIAQRGTSATGIAVSGYYTVDRFLVGQSALGTFTQTQDTDAPDGQGFANSLKMQCTIADASPVAGGVLNIQQVLEGANLQQLNFGTAYAKSLTLSFWIKSNKTGTYVLNIRQTSGTTRRIVVPYTIDTANTWEKKTITVEGDTSGLINNDNNRALQVTWWLGAGSNYTSGTAPTGWGVAVEADYAPSQANLADSTSNYINLTGVQLEVGTTATPFEHRPYGQELAMCQRYYQKIIDPPMRGVATGGTAGGASRLGLFFANTMRATPTLAINGTFTFWNGSAPTTGTVLAGYWVGGLNGLDMDIGIAAAITQGQAVCQYITGDSNKYVTLSSEL
jgi:hypothetical protein